MLERPIDEYLSCPFPKVNVIIDTCIMIIDMELGKNYILVEFESMSLTWILYIDITILNNAIQCIESYGCRHKRYECIRIPLAVLSYCKPEPTSVSQMGCAILF